MLAPTGATLTADAVVARAASGAEVVLIHGPLTVSDGDVVTFPMSVSARDYVAITLTQVTASGSGDGGIIHRPLHDQEIPVDFSFGQDCGVTTVALDIDVEFVEGRGKGNAHGIGRGKGQGRGKSKGKGFDTFRLNTSAHVGVDVTGCDPCADPVVFADATLEADIRARLGIPSGAIVGTELARLDTLGVAGAGISSLSGLECAVNLASVFASDNSIADLSPLAGADGLEVLEVARNPIASIEPLRSKPLRTLNVSGTPRFSDLSALQDTATLEALFISGEPGVSPEITDISALANKPALRRLQLVNQGVSDIGPLANATQLTEVNLANNPVTSIEALRGKPLTSLIVSGRPQFTDLSPLAGATSLRTLVASTSRGATPTISDLGPLAGATSLSRLELRNHGVSDLSPIAAITTLRNLAFSNNPITDTSPLAGRCDLSVIFFDTRSLTCPDATLDALEACGVTVVSLCP